VNWRRPQASGVQMCGTHIHTCAQGSQLKVIGLGIRGVGAAQKLAGACVRD